MAEAIKNQGPQAPQTVAAANVSGVGVVLDETTLTSEESILAALATGKISMERALTLLKSVREAKMHVHARLEGTLEEGVLHISFPVSSANLSPTANGNYVLGSTRGQPKLAGHTITVNGQSIPVYFTGQVLAKPGKSRLPQVPPQQVWNYNPAE